MKLPRLTWGYPINNFSSYTKGIVGHCHDQVFYIHNSFFENAYGIATHPLVLIYTFIFMAKYTHGEYSAFEVSFGTIPDTIHFMHYTLWDPIYYYESE